MRASGRALRRIRGRKLLAGVSGIAVACWFPATASAATYVVSNATELNNAVAAANADGDASATIVATQSFVAGNMPNPTKPITLDTQGFTITGIVGNNFGVTTTNGNLLTLSGTFQGAASAGTAGVGFNQNGGTIPSTITNNGTVIGGSSSGGAGGVGLSLTGLTTFNNSGTITGGSTAAAASGGGTGAQVRRDSSMTNFGTIEGGSNTGGFGGGVGIDLGGTGTNSTVTNHGTIRGGSGAGNALSSGVGILVRNGSGQIVNTGTIEGGNLAAAIRSNSATETIDIVNSGIIRAGTGATEAIGWTSGVTPTTGSIHLELQTGSQIFGNVVANATATTDLLRLSGTGISILDGSIGDTGQYRNFDVFEKTGSGTWALTADNTATTNWDIQQGTLQLGNGGTSGSIVGDVTNNGTLAFKRSDTLAYSGIISGTGTVSQIGTGTTVLTGTNTYSGGTAILGGILQVSSNENLGAASGALTFNTGTLQTTSAFTSGRNVTLTGNGTFQTDSDLGLTGGISGSGLLTKTGAGTLTLSGNNSYTGGTRILGGTLEAEGGNAIGDQSSVIAQAGVFRVLDNETVGTLSGDAGTVELVGNLTTSTNFANTTALFYGGITGTGGFVKNGAYRQVLAGNSSYQGATQILAGTLFAVGAGIDSIPDSSAVTVAAGATLSLVRPPLSPIFTGIDSDDETIGSLSGAGNVNLGDRKLTIGSDASTTFSGLISGAGGSLAKLGNGTLTLSGTNTYTGATTVDSGGLRVNGSLGNTAVSVNSSGTLSGVGTIAGPVTVDGTVAPGNSPGTLTVGSLTLNTGSNLDYELGIAGTIGNGVNDLIEVTGDLTLDGTLNITDIGGFGPGVYRLMNYGGVLTDNGLQFGTTPVAASDLFIQTAIDGQVNLISTAGATLSFWDGGNAGLHDNGLIDGGDGVWDATNRNWTEADGAINGPWGQDFAVFAGRAGIVTVDDSAGTVGFTGMQFMIDGYVIDGGTLTTNTAATMIKTDAGVTATIAADIAGSGGLVKTDSGALVLSGANTYSGGTAISAGTLIGQATSFGTGDILNDASLVFDQPTDATFAAAIDGSGSLTKKGLGNLNLTGISGLGGPTTVEAGKLSVNGSLANSAVTILGGGALGGNGTVGATTLQAGGVIAPGNSIGTLTIDGNYIGTGGTLEIEAMLDGDASSTDRLVITGDTSGATNVKVIGVGGSGAQTSEGIKIVDVGGISAGTFSLLGNYVFEGDQAVVAGAYAYRLYKNGISTPSDGDWYLRSSLISPNDPTPPVDPTPLYSPAVPIYETYAGVLQSFTQLGTLQQRVGNRSWGGTRSGAGNGVEQGSPIWGRIEAAHSEFDPGTTTTGADYDADLWRLQAGLDTLLSETEAGVLIGGVTVHYGTARSDVSSVFGVGSIDATGYGFGGTMTWYGKSGFYVDTQAELTWFDSDLASSTLGKTLAKGNDGFGYGLGIEAGQKIAVQGNWSLTPQAQLSYSSVDFDSFTDPYGALVSNDGSDSLVGRLGLSADYEGEWKDKAGQSSRSHVYGVANLYYDFLDGYDVDVSGTKLVSKAQPLWGGLGVGGSLSWADDRYSVHGELLARTSMEDFGDSHAFGGTVGFKVKW
ncbi:autotransporter outer membrane beta-barrel domain-containing protein [Mesorhizobium sp. WSM4904]|uniref:autotransporter outer membrane beta-barrel domain-containing protein n=1 Tax=Mesorhizobium sp. WSM4904 TaxID=3038545 RepID=UPI0024186A7E|nr:autotransporter outer membrane beta-barrel domain-containing protein [Mesorhizobium sp. WSM4904]WFP65440.1 autotransporter outer membrane beta-barrel domain-containing protein [Mesorhizobium sp. WSM4904]